MRNSRSVYRFAAVALLLACSAFAQSRIDKLVQNLPKAQGFDQAAISPDGSRVAYIQEGTIGIVPSAGGATVTISPGPGLEARDLAWSPDSKRLAFVANRPHDANTQVYVTEPGANVPVQPVTKLTGYMEQPKWSPDGKALAFLFVENAPRRSGALGPFTPQKGVVEEKIYEQRIATVDPATGAVKQVSPADLFVYEYDWAPDGKSWAAIAAHGSGENNWWIARLYNIATDTGQLRELVKPELQIAIPRYSPDGKYVAFISGLMSDAGVVGGDIYVVPSSGGAAKNITPGLKASPSWLAWTGAEQILFAANVDGSSGVGTVSIAAGAPQMLWKNFELVSADDWAIGISLADDHKTSAVIRQSLRQPPEVWAGELGKWKQLTSINASMKPIWGEARDVRWSNEGNEIQGWLVAPPKVDPAKKYPLVITVHGGPSAACLPRWLTNENAVLPAAGYFLLCPNPRGSFGQGAAFTQANRKDFGGGDFRDIVASIDAVAKQAPIDAKRVGVKGHSYGGFMTMWATSQTNRFKAAVAGAGLSNWQSYYGQNSIDQWMIPFFGASVYDDPAVYAKSAPINFVKSVKTPTLILVGDSDGEVPAPQSYEWWHALKTLGVPVQFVVYPNEGHRIAAPEHVRDVMVRTVGWFDRWMGEAANSAAAGSSN